MRIVQPYKVVDRQVPPFCLKTIESLSLSLDCMADTWSLVFLCSFNSNLTHFNTVFFEPQGYQGGQVQNRNVSGTHNHTLLCLALIRTHHTSWCIFSKFIHLSRCPQVHLPVLSQECISVPVFDLRWIHGCQWFYHACLAAHFVDVDLTRPVMDKLKLVSEACLWPRCRAQKHQNCTPTPPPIHKDWSPSLRPIAPPTDQSIWKKIFKLNFKPFHPSWTETIHPWGPICSTKRGRSKWEKTASKRPKSWSFTKKFHEKGRLINTWPMGKTSIFEVHLTSYHFKQFQKKLRGTE